MIPHGLGASWGGGMIVKIPPPGGVMIVKRGGGMILKNPPPNWGHVSEKSQVAIAVAEDGFREVIGVTEGAKEDKEGWGISCAS